MPKFVDWQYLKHRLYYTVITCEMKIFRNSFEIISVFYFSFVSHVTTDAEIILKSFRRHLTCWKTFMSCNELQK